MNTEAGKGQYWNQKGVLGWVDFTYNADYTYAQLAFNSMVTQLSPNSTSRTGRCSFRGFRGLVRRRQRRASALQGLDRRR